MDGVETQARQRRRRVSVTNSLERVRHLQTSHQLERQQWSRGAEHDAARRTFIQRKGRALRTQHALLGVPSVHDFSPDSVPASSGTTGVGATYPTDPHKIISERFRTWTLDSTPDLGPSLSRARRRRPEQFTFVLPGRRRPPLRRMQSSNSINPRSIQYRLEETPPSPVQHNNAEDVTDKVAAFLEKACVLAETDRDPRAEKTSNIEERIKKYETRKRQMQRRTSLVYCPGSAPMDGSAVGSMKRISVVAPTTESTIDETDSSSEENEPGETRMERLERLRALPPLLLPPIYTVRTRQPARQTRSWPPPRPRVPRRISQRVWDELKECRYIRQKTGAGKS
ncbi:Hypp1968 [Branchiostoma lanceolatum]|uniref:Hypp1968 protein n=1 Tax=Branchiostoma lanceolatum TaxID=7740 RepID=A0A8J9ZNV2_BRALA|nr:Hypp1968 [Branchiostoma lanceolatum]